SCHPPSSVICPSHHTATIEIYTLSLHDALPILEERDRYQAFIFAEEVSGSPSQHRLAAARTSSTPAFGSRQVIRSRSYQTGLMRSEEHTSELQSRFDLVCRLLLEKKKYI